MTVETLDHFTIVTADLDTSVAFYTDVLGLENGKRPDLGFPGAWIYAGDKAVVHLLGSDGADMMAKGGITGGSANGEDAGPQGTGSIHHVAFRATGIDDYVSRLKAANISHKENEVPGWPLKQVFLHDPDGVTIELNFWEE